MALVNLIAASERENMGNFTNDIKEFMTFIEPIRNDLEIIIDQHNNHTAGSKWDEKEQKFQIIFITLERRHKLKDVLFKILDTYLKENIEEWKVKFGNRPGFEYEDSLYYVARGVTLFAVNLLMRVYEGENLDYAIEQELDTLFKIKSPITKRYKKIIVQNLVLGEDQKFHFKTIDLPIKGQEFRWHQDGVPKSCVVPDFSLTFQIMLSRLTEHEFDLFLHRHGLLAYQMKPFTCLEIIYDLPNDRFSSLDSLEHFKYLLASKKAKEFIQKLVSRIVQALKLTTAGYIHPTIYQSEPLNYYEKDLFSQATAITPKNYMYSFFISKSILSSKRLRNFREIFDSLTNCQDFPLVSQVLTMIERADLALQFNFHMMALTIYWMLMETIIKSQWNKGEIIDQIPKVYKANDYGKEKRFWRLVYSLRNKYVHGDNWNLLRSEIQKVFPQKNIQWLALVCREKTIRILLFLLLMRESTNPEDPLLRKPRNFRNPRIPEREWNKFHRWIQKDGARKLGDLDNYKIGRKLQPSLL